MTRREFIKALRKRLSFLSKEELEKEVLHYINEIDKSKKPNEEVIKSFGSIEDICKKVCKEHGIAYKKVSNKGIVRGFQTFYDNLLSIGSILRKSDNKKRISLLLDLLLLLVVTCVLKIPFIFVRDLGDNFVNSFFQANIAVLAIWGLIIELLYVIAALAFFMNTLAKWVAGLEEEN